ncbi:MAG: bacillithiol biosynthesis BshC, partial [Cyclobacteriaceae bacterium]
MKHEQVDLDETGCFSDFFLDYISGKDQLKPFYGNPPYLSSFGDQIKTRSFPGKSRKILVDTLKEQYEGLQINDAVRKNIEALSSENTYTVTTGHQLNIFTGPMYVIYKLVTIIRACEELSNRYPEYNFVPIYWMASEDHD